MLGKTILISAVVALLTVSSSARGMNSERQHNDQSVKEYQSDTSANHGEHRGQNNRANMGQGSFERGSLIADIPLSELTQTQTEGLIFMIEEEKVARDVYTHLYNTWGTRVFGNIARAEQRHMDALIVLLDRYELDTPIGLEIPGVFNNEELQSLYDKLTVQGDSSLVEALEVGVLIEEVDIADLEELVTDVPADFKVIYDNLLRGSYNHLNAFNRQLARQ